MELLFLFLIIFFILWMLGILLPYLIPIALILYLWYHFIGKKKIRKRFEENISFYQFTNQEPDHSHSLHSDAIDVEYTEYEESDGNGQ